MSADLKSDLGKENVDKERNTQRTSAKKGRKSEPLSRPVSFQSLSIFSLHSFFQEF